MADSPSNKILDPKTGKKFEKSEDLREHVHSHFSNIFKFKKQINQNIETFLGETKDSEMASSKKLTEDEKEENEKDLSIEELEDSLKCSHGGKTPGIDAIEKSFLTRYWDILKNTIKNATDFFISITSLNRYLEKGLILFLSTG